MINVENINQVTNQLVTYATNVRREVANLIIEIGDRVVNELQKRFPDLTISGQFFGGKFEYWLVIARFGEELTHIKCPVSNLYFKRKKDEFGKQEFVSTVPELDTEEIVKEIANQISLQLNVIGKGM